MKKAKKSTGVQIQYIGKSARKCTKKCGKLHGRFCNCHLYNSVQRKIKWNYLEPRFGDPD
jgi:hypothetical protein